jgi:hypothetical protein
VGALSGVATSYDVAPDGKRFVIARVAYEQEANVEEFLDQIYNRVRLHSALNGPQQSHRAAERRIAAQIGKGCDRSSEIVVF